MRRRQQAQRPARPRRNALVAAATRGGRGGSPAGGRSKPQSWQEEAWTYYDSVGEVQNAVTFVGWAASKVRVFAAVRPPGADPEAEPVPVAQAVAGPITAQVAAIADDEMRKLSGATGGQGEVMRELAQNLDVAGDAYLIGWGPRADGDVLEPERWEVRSVSEVEWKSPAGTPPERQEVLVKGARDAKGVRLDMTRDAVVRIWTRHPRWSDLARSQMFAVLTDCRILAVLGAQELAEAYSRIGSGLLTVPNELSFGGALPGDPSDPDDLDDPVEQDPNETEDSDPFTQELTTALMTPRADPSDPTAVVPTIIRGPAEYLTPDKLRWIDLGRGGDGSALAARVEAKVQRLARGLALPVEVVMGHQQTTFANAEQVDEDTFADYLEPRMRVIVDGLTMEYLRPNLVERGVPAEVAEQVIVWFDASELIADPDPGEAADYGRENGLISGAAWRREKGYSEADAPTDQELARTMFLRRGIFTAEFTNQGLIFGGLDVGWTPPEEAPEGELPAGDSIDQEAALAAAAARLGVPPDDLRQALMAGAEGARRGRPPFALAAAGRKPPGRRLMSIDRQLRTRLAAAADVHLGRALERAANKLSHQAQFRAAARRHDRCQLAAELGRDAVVAAVPVDELFAGSWDGLEASFKAWARTGAGDALEVVSQVVSGLSIAERDALGARLAGSIDEAWEWLRVAMTDLGDELLFAAGPVVDTLGEVPVGRVPDSLLRHALARAGGVQGLLTSGTGSAFVTVAESGRAAAGGIATGGIVRGTLRDRGVIFAGYRWEYGEAARARPFLPHRALDGVEFDNFDDPVLTNSAGWPPFGFYMPGDHAGCLCDFEPILADS